MNDKDINKIDEMYKKTALTLVILGLGIWGILLLSADDDVKYFGQKYILLALQSFYELMQIYANPSKSTKQQKSILKIGP